MIRVVSRSSTLAKVQVEEIINLLPSMEFEVSYCRSFGDNHHEISLLNDSVPDDFFTRELDLALRDGSADIAIHSAKDLPLPLPDDLICICLTEGEDQSDSLVTPSGDSIQSIKEGARIGTSSPSRRDQILKLRPDCEIVSIRGSIEERVAYIDRDEVDGVVVASCALKRLKLNIKSTTLPIDTHPLQGKLVITARRDRVDLIPHFLHLDSRRFYGRVCFAGAGPGDPDLITVAVKKRIDSCDIILYDDLVNPQIFLDSPAEKIYVGKRKGKHSIPQPDINRLMWEEAKKGRSVLRLKGGDSLLFARLGEELRYLHERMVQTEVIPGISSCQAGAASLNIPLTDRKDGRSLHLFTAFSADSTPIESTDSGTQVFFMGSDRGEKIREALSAKNWPLDTPISAITNASRVDEKVHRCTIETLSMANLESPTIIIAGDVNRSAYKQLRFLHTGVNPDQICLPGKIQHIPFIRCSNVDLPPLDTDRYSGAVFTSRIAVKNLLKLNRIPEDWQIFAIGPITAKSLRDEGYSNIFVPQKHESDHLAQLISEKAVGRLIYPCSTLSKNILHERSNIEVVPVYITEPVIQEGVDLEGFDAIIFSSSSAIRSFFDQGYHPLDSNHLFVFGSKSSETLQSYGIEPHRISTLPHKESL